MRNWLLIAAMLACAASGAQAGAWLREPGEAFVAASTTLRNDRATHEDSLFFEYGLRDRMTVGLDLNLRVDGAGHALAFMRMPVTQWADGSRMAVQLGLGAHRSARAAPGRAAGPSGAMGKLAVMYGRSLGPTGGGWFGLEAAVEHRAGVGAPIFKLDSVAGLPVGGRLQPMIKLETYHVPGRGSGWALTPSVILKPARGPRWVAGLEYRQARGGGSGNRTLGLTLALWHRF